MWRVTDVNAQSDTRRFKQHEQTQVYFLFYSQQKEELQASSSSSAGSSQKKEKRDLREQAFDENEVFLRRRRYNRKHQEGRKEKELKTANHENKDRNKSHFSVFALVVCQMKADWWESHASPWWF